MVCKTDTEDWFQSLKGGLHWNRPNEEMRKPSSMMSSKGSGREKELLGKIRSSHL